MLAYSEVFAERQEEKASSLAWKRLNRDAEHDLMRLNEKKTHVNSGRKHKGLQK